MVGKKINFALKNGLIWSGLASVILGFSGCDREKQDFCGAGIHQELSAAVTSLEPLRGVPRLQWSSSLRGPASLPSEGTSGGLQGQAQAGGEETAETVTASGDTKPHFTREIREKWQKWCELKLKKVEAAIDSMNQHKHESDAHEQARKHLSGVADQLVEFHGFAQQHRVDQMISSLKEIQGHEEAIRMLSCN